MALNLQQSIYAELADFLVSEPTLEAIAAYRVPDGIQSYIDQMLEKNREGGLPPQEQLDLEKILAITHVFDLAKAKARLKLKHRL